ncbi:sensor histidine kinase [Nocardia sp. NBC_01009]|uniref:sensor histidine kinase n=1 Tax=Nocardia sp. NBC_01009 TaxID=2975996 RepID=UPI0038707B25|nr:histidine kinase [Nocardia sp. NBC_01009]
MVDSAGVTRGVEWALDARSLPVRLIALGGAAVGCLLLLSDAPGPVDWVIGLLAVLATAGGVGWPLVTSLVTTGLLAVGFEIGQVGPVVAKVAAAIALIELAARRGGWQPLLASAALGGAYLLHPAGGVAATGYRALVMAGAPLLIGSLLRTAREGAERARWEAGELTLRRESDIAAARALERTAIARELHDLIAHHVSSTVLRVGVARHAVPDAPPAVREVLDDIHASGTETLADLRLLVSILRDPAMAGESFIAPTDLPAALTGVADRAAQLGHTIEVHVDDAVTTVDALRALTLLRLTQEGIANIVRHTAPGTKARLTIDVIDDGTVDFVLCDRGMRTEPKGTGHGLGLVGLRERVELLGGEFTAGPGDMGWQLVARLPTAARVST